MFARDLQIGTIYKLAADVYATTYNPGAHAWNNYIPAGSTIERLDLQVDADEGEEATVIVRDDAGRQLAIEAQILVEIDGEPEPDIATPEGKVRILANMCERDERGRHFTQVYSEAVLDTLESKGLIKIARPVHEQTGIPYSEEHYHLEVTQAGNDLVARHTQPQVQS